MNSAPDFFYIRGIGIVYIRMRAVINIQRDMNRPGKETLRRIIHKIHKQNDCEKFIELASVLTGMLRKFNFYSVELSSDVPSHSFPLSIKNVFTQEQLSLPELFCRTSYSWWNRLRIKRTTKQQSEVFTY